jgi:hypothetical protein
MKDEQTGGVAPARVAKGDRVPAVALRRWSSDEPFDLRPSRGPRVLVTLHGPGCGDCLRYLEEIAAVRGAVESWGGDIVAVSPPVDHDTGEEWRGIVLPVLKDPERVLSDGRPAVVIADEWGEVYFASGSAETHAPISPEEVVEWVKFVSIQCPECEGPEGEWRTL